MKSPRLGCESTKLDLNIKYYDAPKGKGTMAKKSKPKKKDSESAAILSLVEPCGDVCAVHEGRLCPECGDFAAFRRKTSESAEDTGEADDSPVQ